MDTSTLSKYDYITSKDLIHSGSPTRYRLTPKEENIGNIKKFILGKRNVRKTNKTILLLGETGTGKSTLINALVNYAIGVTWADNVWFEIVKNDSRSQIESQTSDVIVYQFFGFEDNTLPYSLTIIDTPGYGSTRGMKEDLIVSQRLFDLFRSADGVHEIDAVGLVLPASVNRLTDRQSYIFDSVTSLFGKDIEKNVVALITNSTGTKPKNALKALEGAGVKFARDENYQPVYFSFNNCQNEDRTTESEPLKNAERMSTKGMKQFTDFLSKTPPQNLKTTLKVMNDRVRLTASIHNLQDRVELIDLKHKEIQQTQKGLEEHEKEIQRNKNFTLEVDEPYKEKEDIDGKWWMFFFYQGATCCTVCEENCHYPGCTIAAGPSWCEVMSNGRCTVCTNKCEVSKHVKEGWRYVTKTRKVKKTLQELKEKYDKSKADKEGTAWILKSLQRELEDLEADKTKLIEEAYQCVVKLEENALNVNSLSTYIHLDVIIEMMEKRGDAAKAEYLQKIQQRMKCSPGRMQYVCDLFSRMFKREKDDRMGTGV